MSGWISTRAVRNGRKLTNSNTRIRCSPSRKHDYIPVGHPYQFVDLSGRAHQMQIGGSRLLHSGVMLRNNSKQLLVAVQGVKQGQRAFAPDGQGLNAPRKKHRIPDR